MSCLATCTVLYSSTYPSTIRYHLMRFNPKTQYRYTSQNNMKYKNNAACNAIHNAIINIIRDISPNYIQNTQQNTAQHDIVQYGTIISTWVCKVVHLHKLQSQKRNYHSIGPHLKKKANIFVRFVLVYETWKRQIWRFQVGSFDVTFYLDSLFMLYHWSFV